MSLLRNILIGLAVLALLAGGFLIPRRPEPSRVVAVHAQPRVVVYRNTEDPMIAVLQAAQQRYDQALVSIADQLARAAAFVDSIPVPIPAAAQQASPRGSRSDGQPALGGGGSITQEQFAALNQCEASGENGWRTGRYGLEGHNDVGSWSLEAQQAEVQRIYNESGPDAWGVLCRGVLGG